MNKVHVEYAIGPLTHILTGNFEGPLATLTNIENAKYIFPEQLEVSNPKSLLGVYQINTTNLPINPTHKLHPDLVQIGHHPNIKGKNTIKSFINDRLGINIDRLKVVPYTHITDPNDHIQMYDEMLDILQNMHKSTQVPETQGFNKIAQDFAQIRMAAKALKSLKKIRTNKGFTEREQTSIDTLDEFLESGGMIRKAIAKSAKSYYR